MTEPAVAAPTGDTRQTTTPTQADPAANNPTATGGHMAATAAKPVDNGAPAMDNASTKGWSENWRELYAQDDTKMLARLQRYTSPKAAIDALVAAQNKISSGELRSPLPPNPTEEQLATYRQQNGIPEKPEGYFEKLPDGLVIGDEDKPLFGDIAQILHKHNLPPGVAGDVVALVNNQRETQLAALAQNDNTHKASAEDSLRAEWGNDYRTNINHISSFLSSAPEGVGDLIANARGADGKALLNDPNTVRWLATVARELNPTGTIVPGGENAMQGVESRMGELNKMMGDRNSAYWKGPTSDKLQKEYRDLVDSQMRLKARAG